MGAFLGISLWVALATVVPGLITIACLYSGAVIVNPEWLKELSARLIGVNDWIWAGFAVAAMVLTQSIGILLENIFVSKRWLGPETRILNLPEGIDPHGEQHIQLKPYFEYEGLYILLSELGEKEDSQGHLKRSLAQFFLTNNTIVSYSLGIAFVLILFTLYPSWSTLPSLIGYVSVLDICLVLSYKVALIRFNVMTKSLWAARRRRSMKPTESSHLSPQRVESFSSEQNKQRLISFLSNDSIH